MTEQCKHEWHFYEESKDGCFCVKGCRGRLSRAEAEARINATARLSAKIARRNGAILRINVDKLPYASQTQGFRDSQDMIAYADILDGREDER